MLEELIFNMIFVDFNTPIKNEYKKLNEWYVHCIWIGFELIKAFTDSKFIQKSKLFKMT